MLCMCRETDDERSTVYVGLRSGVVQAFDCMERRFTVEYDATGGVGTLVGVAKHKRALITCTDKGSLSFWPSGEEKLEMSVGTHTSCMAASETVELQVATGGRENPLKVWDGNSTKSPIFTAKNVRSDALDLRVPVWDNQMAFTPDSGPQPILVVGTGYGNVRLYDTRAQRRPVFSTKYGNEPITALDITPDGKCCVVGNSVGDIARFELRKGDLIGQYKGCNGGVSSVRVSGDGSILAVCGLDRYLRVYQLERPKLMYQVYLKLQCRCLMFNDTFTTTPSAGINHSSSDNNTTQEEMRDKEKEEGEDSDEEDLWGAMETVEEEGSRGTKRKSITRERERSRIDSKRKRINE